GRGTVTGRAVLERRVVHIPDAAADSEYTLSEALTMGKARTTLGVPLLRENEPSGVIVLARQRVQPFTDHQIGLARTFADQAVLAIENVRLFEALRQRTGEREEALEHESAATELLRVINSTPGDDFAPVFDAILEQAMQLCDASAGGLRSYDGERFGIVASVGLPPAFVEARRTPQYAGP